MANDHCSDLLLELQVTDNIMSTAIESPRSNSPKVIDKNEITNNIESGEYSDQDQDLVKRGKRRVQQFSDSESDEEKENCPNGVNALGLNNEELSPNNQDTRPESNEETTEVSKICVHKSRIRTISTSEDDSDAACSESVFIKNEQQQLRMLNKRKKLKEKFKKITLSRGNNDEMGKVLNTNTKSDSSSDHFNNVSSESSCDEDSSVVKIKMSVKKEMTTFKTTLCDPDTSDEETHSIKSPQKKNERKTTILTSPKPMRLTAKQALENMQKIKSESNRMLREKEVSLPYHRPKALSLKDIMSRRKPAVASDGKALPIKMNNEQLKQYVQLLEQRQKEMMELCKSDTDEEEEREIEPQYDCLNLETDLNKPEKSKENEICDNNDASNENEYTNITQCLDNANIDKEKKSSGLPENVLIDETKDISNSEMKLINNDFAVDVNMSVDNENKHADSDENVIDKEATAPSLKQAIDSQLLSLHYDSDILGIGKEINNSDVYINTNNKTEKTNEEYNMIENDFDNDLNIEEIDKIIENAEIIKDSNCKENKLLMSETGVIPKNIMPKLTGAPGMVIDLDATDPFAVNKPSGVELLKERFTYFAKLKTPEELEREKEKRLKPGTQHLKLKQELEEKIAEQRSLEWAKRLEKEKQNNLEINDDDRGNVSDEEDIEKIEAKLEHDEALKNESSGSEEEEEEMDDIEELKDVPRKRNPMIDDEAEESDIDECDDDDELKAKDGKNKRSSAYAEINDENDTELEEGNDDNEDDVEEDNDSDSNEDESSESEVEINSKTKKGRILKAFEDSDDEEISVKSDIQEVKALNENNNKQSVDDNPDFIVNDLPNHSHAEGETQDDDLQLAQIHKSFSEDLFTSQESGVIGSSNPKQAKEGDGLDLGTQTFSILNTDGNKKSNGMFNLGDADKLTVICETQPDDDNLDAIVGMCSGSFSQNLVTSQFPTTQSQSQVIGEDILNLCTGKFYNNEFVSQIDDGVKINAIDKASQKIIEETHTEDSSGPAKAENDQKSGESNLLKSILDELNDPEFDIPKGNKYFPSNTQNNENNMQYKKKFVIESDDEIDKPTDVNGTKKKKKNKKKKLEKRALQISDDEDEYSEEEIDDVMSDVEEDAEENAAKFVEYDSEENEVEVKPQNSKKKRKMAEFFEQEAELTSEDEWVGSGDEDEAGLDRMEREEGDDETFNQTKLQRELGQIHLRDVLDQDKREVRIIQELMFEDGDLGVGGRQRKFRWRNTDGEEEVGTMSDDFADTQEEEFESEEQWRKQRHEREVYLRQMEQKQDETEDNLNMSINRTTIIKANLCSRTMSNLLSEVKKTTDDKANSPTVLEKKTNKDIPSPKKAFAVFQQSYHGSLLSRGRGSLARLAALATPLAVDDDAPKFSSLLPSNKKNFVFAALSQEDNKPKVTKRKAETKIGTPRLVKKMKTEENKKLPKNSLFDYLNRNEMANESNEIGSIIKKCKILLLDIEGTTTSISFVKDKLFPYAEENVKQFLESKWEEEKVKEAVDALRKLALEDKEKNVEGVVTIPGEDATKEEQIEGLVNNVKWQMSLDRKAGPLKLLQGLIWKQGYDNGEIKGHVYDDVSPALEQWRTVEGQKVYIYSSGSVEAQKLLFGQSMAGDLLPFIDGHFDTAVGAKQEAASYTTIVEKIGCKSDEILFLTDIVKEAEAARASGLHVALVSREGNAPLPAEATAAFPVLQSLAQLTVTNKRKTDPQEEQPAKVAKTDVEKDVKTTVETNTAEVTTVKESNNVESMEVEETPIEEKVKESNNDLEMTDEVTSKTEIKEITDANEVADIPTLNIKPVIIEDNVDKVNETEAQKMDTEVANSDTEKLDTEKTDTEKMDTELSNSDVPTSDESTKPQENSDLKKEEKTQSVSEEIPAVVITEIEDVSDKQTLSEVAEIIEDLEPVVEEPAVVEDMEELQNVGEVLEKECDEILSKVQDVTNLDNIPLKPLLNPIAEETIETDNVDSNDIVDRILDTELEMEMKQCNDIDLNTVEEIKETKTDKESDKPVQEEVNDTTTPVTNDVPEEKTTETEVEANNVIEKVEESSPTETETTLECKPEEVEKEKEKPVEIESNDASTVQKPTENSDSIVTLSEEIKEEEKLKEVETESEVKEPHVNGKDTNGDAETLNLNGDASKVEELNSRLSVENGKEVVNGSNGDSRDSEKVQIDNVAEADIKVKTVAVEEPRTDPIEQPTEA
ncbi:claspin [Galleria mellonella]|uniref:Enolase-phosphatase E1 n=1 Tax=Galleria mellonella TaxID=7137 RepID=A0ABM3MZH3_GALME|nr:claspin [Galleria mellonella]